MSPRTERLRPAIALRPAEVAEARRRRRLEPSRSRLRPPWAWPWRKSRRRCYRCTRLDPESTWCTINVTLAAHAVCLQESLRQTSKSPSSLHAYSPGALILKSRLDPAVCAELSAVGHAVAGLPALTWKAGAVCAVRQNDETGVLTAGADPRRPSYVVGRRHRQHRLKQTVRGMLEFAHARESEGCSTSKAGTDDHAASTNRRAFFDGQVGEDHRQPRFRTTCPTGTLQDLCRVRPPVRAGQDGLRVERGRVRIIARMRSIVPRSQMPPVM